MGDMIDRDAVLERLELAEHDAEERNWRSGANEIARLRKYVAALPAIVPQPAPRLPDLGAREAALREAAQCAIDNQDCSPWEVSEAILNLIGKKPAGPYPAEAEVSTLRDRLARMEGALEFQEQQRRDVFARRHMSAPEDPHVYVLCERYGYGAVMDAASRLWARKDSMGAFYIGGCIGIKPTAALSDGGRNG